MDQWDNELFERLETGQHDRVGLAYLPSAIVTFAVAVRAAAEALAAKPLRDVGTHVSGSTQVLTPTVTLHESICPECGGSGVTDIITSDVGIFCWRCGGSGKITKHA